MLISSLIYCYIDALENDYQGSDVSHKHNPNVDYFYDFYSKPWYNISSFIIGIYFCELFLKTPIYKNDHSDVNPQEDLEKPKNIIRRLNEFLIENEISCYIMLIIGLIFSLGAVFSSNIIINNEVSLEWYSFYLNFAKFFLIIGIGIILHLTFLGKFKILKYFLTFRIFSLLSKTLYAIYIIHLYVIFIYLFSLEFSPYFYILDATYVSIGVFCFTGFISIIIMALIESPIVNVMKPSKRE